MKGTEAIENLIDTVEVIGVNAKKVLADGKLNAEDLDEAVEVLKHVEDFAKVIADIKSGELIEEGKDIDEAEAAKIGFKLFASVKKIVKAE